RPRQGHPCACYSLLLDPRARHKERLLLGESGQGWGEGSLLAQGVHAFLVNLLPIHHDFFRGGNAESYFSALDGYDRDADIVANNDLFPDFPGQDQHTDLTLTWDSRECRG